MLRRYLIENKRLDGIFQGRDTGEASYPEPLYWPGRTTVLALTPVGRDNRMMPTARGEECVMWFAFDLAVTA